MSNNPLIGWEVDPANIRYIGHDLQRPECILAERDGSLWVADGRGGVMHIAHDGEQTLILQQGQEENTATSFEDRLVNTKGSLPNGLAFAENGDFLIANFGTDRVEVMKRSGETSVLVDNIDGKPIGKANFVTRDRKGRLWLTVTTTMIPWTEHVKCNSRDGYIALLDEKGIRIVADNLCGTNELRFDRNEEWLYVAETTSRNITRFRVRGDELVDREIFGPSNVGGFCDGIAFDAYGNLWSTLIMADRLIAITPDGELLTLLDLGGESDALAALDTAWEQGQVTPELMAACGSTECRWMASLTFGGADLKTVYLGSLQGQRIPYFKSPVAGLPLIYW
ncbi:SMP-30/gluconolactonase/LRE family protein [Rhizobium sp. L1K21]|uniref:SMP-30/gluconolactonase/LRE family protein n=1 Tax=Rhizobium sp. L1K21 TaxID=2954933 RepID=UPI002092CAB6|nr:SMP-30/gluconolactonase/LRE family protein [Rhizobium sp. L1K21]MCO6187584.1 SMP-30/gluconolactonase/LRE family protein [Rhizobium sp. L1K21]